MHASKCREVGCHTGTLRLRDNRRISSGYWTRAEVKRQGRFTASGESALFSFLGAVPRIDSTSGLSWKIPGRVGDSPILGAGLYLDNEVGSAGSTGVGEANLLNLSSYLVVEGM